MSEFAPEYSKREKIVLVAKLLAVIIPLALLSQYWFFPALNEYAENAHCHQYGPVNGLDIVFYGTFIGLPLSLALVIFILEGRRSIKVLKIGQHPLPGEKVLKPTRYTYGWKAKIGPVLILVVIASLVGFSVWGTFAAQHMISMAEKKRLPSCDGVTSQVFT